MILNRMDFWECPDCHLQAAGNKGFFIVLRERGKGEFARNRVSATEQISGATLLKQSESDSLLPLGYLRTEKEFRYFIEKEVAPFK
jgi:hypothetical protein